MAIIDELVTLLGVRMSPDAAGNIQGFKSKMASLGKGVTVAVAALTGARVAVQAFVQAAAGQAAELQKLSDTTGISTDRLQEWGYAATAIGANAKAVQSDIANLQKRFGMMGSSDRILGSLAGQFNGMNPQQAAMMGAQYGISGDTIMLLRQGADGIARLKKEAHDIGAIIPEKDIQRGAEFTKTIGKLTYGLKALGTMIALGALPAMEKFTIGFQRFITANREFIKEKTQVFINGLVMGFDRFADRVSFLWDKLKPLREAFSKLTESMQGSEIVAHLVEGALIVLAIAAGVALLPFVKTIALFTLLAIIAEDLFESIMTGEGVFADLWRTITGGKGALQGIIDPLVNLGKTLWDYIEPALKAAWSIIKDVCRAIQDMGAAVMGFVDDYIGPFVQGVSDVLDMLEPWYDMLLQIITIVAKFTLGVIVGQFKTLLGVLGPVIEGIGKFISLIGKAGKWATDKLGIADMADQLRDFADSADVYEAGKTAARHVMAIPDTQATQRISTQGKASNTTVNDNSQRTYNITSPDPARVPELIERRESNAAINGYGQFAPVAQ